MRVGFGYDIHQLKVGRPCILGGVHIESELGPDGHSDADVLIHALMDVLQVCAILDIISRLKMTSVKGFLACFY